MKKPIFRKRGDQIFYIIITIILTAFFVSVLYPCIFVIASSFSSSKAILGGKVFLWPVGFNLEGYRTVFSMKTVWIGYANSIFITIAGTFINIAVTMVGAYVLSRRDLPGRNGMTLYFVFTMFFSGGLIPSYILIKNLGMINTRWALILPGALSVYNMIVARTFIQNNIPLELFEAARIDGCSDFKYLYKVVLPLSKAVMAVLTLFYGVGHWNSYLSPMIYLSDQNKYPLTLYLREILLLSKIDPSSVTDPELLMKLVESTAGMKYSLIMVSLIPILLIYPLVQKYFVKGVMMGSLKG